MIMEEGEQVQNLQDEVIMLWFKCKGRLLA